MTYRGKMTNGVVVLEGKQLPAEGTPVTVSVVKARVRRPAKGRKPTGTMYDGLKPFIGMGAGLPPDASQNVEHYLYGAPKQK
jgi:hypothetical protein